MNQRSRTALSLAGLAASVLLSGCATSIGGPDTAAGLASAQQTVTQAYGHEAMADPAALARDEVRCYLVYLGVGANLAQTSQEAAADLITEAQYTLYAAYVVERASGKDESQAVDSVRALRTANSDEVAKLADEPATANPLLSSCDDRRKARQAAIKPFTAPTLQDATTDRI